MDTAGRIVAAWNDARFGDYQCAVSYSHDGGGVWAPAILFRNLSYDFAGDPVVTADDAGNIYFACMSANRSPGVGSTIEVRRTSDGGITWSSPVDVGLPTWEDDRPWIAAHGNGTVFVAWRHNVDPPNAYVAFRASTDHGQSWSPATFASPLNGVNPGMGVDETGAVHLTFWENGGVVYRRSEDGGASFSPTVWIGPAGNDCSSCTPRSSQNPMIAVTENGRDLYVVWSSDMGSPTGEDVWLARSHDGGAAWAVGRANDDTGNARQFMPFVDVDWEGRVHVAWSDLRSGLHEVYYANSTDGGATFVPSIPVTDQGAAVINFQGDYQTFLVDDRGLAHVAWCDTRNDSTQSNGDIYYARAKVASASPFRIEVSPASSQVPADDALQFSAVIYDRDGNTLPLMPEWSVTNGSIDGTGWFVPWHAGNITVTASLGGVSGVAFVEVHPGALDRVEVMPSFAWVAVGGSQQFASLGFDAKGNEVPIVPSWSSTNGSVDSSGLFVPWSTGTWQITAIVGSVSGTATVAVLGGPVIAVGILPSSVTLSADETMVFTAVGYDYLGNQVPLDVSWAVDNGVISSDGLYAPWAAGTWNVTASYGALEGRAVARVVPGSVHRIQMVPANATLYVGENVIFLVYPFDAKGNLVDNASTGWSLEGDHGTLDEIGRFSATRPGSGKVKATVGDVEATAEVTVVERPMIDASGFVVFLVVVLALGAIAGATLLLWKRRRGRKNQGPLS